MVRQLMATGMAAAAAFTLASASGAQAQPASSSPQCFFPSDWNGWKATPDSRAIYIRVGVSKIYRLDFANACTELQQPDAHLVTKVRGSGTYCTALDFDISVSQTHGIPTPCIASKLTQLTPAEAAALPKELRP